MQDFPTKSPRPQHLRFRFNLTTIDQLENTALCKILHMILASMGMLQILFLILVNSHFSRIIAIF